MQHLLSAYKRNNVVFVKGEGCFLYDIDGNKYLDFASGIAVNGLGHNNAHLNEKLKEQIDKLWHCSNLFRNLEQERYAQRLCEISFADRVFFCSSGLEANETAVKIIRKFHHERQNAEKEYILTLNNGFHGRSIAMLSACANNHNIHEGFQPLVKGFKACGKSVEELVESINETTQAVMFELVQSEGGVHILTKAVIDKIISLCKKYEALIFIDEVQTGFARCGSLFGYQEFNINPDIVTCAKSIGNGFPLAVCLMTETVASCITPGSHGGTYGGNPLACSVGNAVLDEFERLDIANNVKSHADYFLSILQSLQSRFPHLVAQVRACGFFGGIELKTLTASQIQKEALLHNLVVTASGDDKVVRILPPLISTNFEFDIFQTKMQHILAKF